MSSTYNEHLPPAFYTGDNNNLLFDSLLTFEGKYIN